MTALDTSEGIMGFENIRDIRIRTKQIKNKGIFRQQCHVEETPKRKKQPAWSMPWIPTTKTTSVVQ